MYSTKTLAQHGTTLCSAHATSFYGLPARDGEVDYTRVETLNLDAQPESHATVSESNSTQSMQRTPEPNIRAVTNMTDGLMFTCIAGEQGKIATLTAAMAGVA